MRALISAVLAVAGSVLTAAPAHAGSAEYLRLLDDKYSYLTTQQLLAEGYKICAALNRGTISPQAVDMVQRDLGGVSVQVALDIVAAAAVGLDC
ncbi:MAG: DUF732 domain-containing protein [Mycobacteriaceae bacterium]|nr:DUF732 domain-containing protein [Mycobacteriaceae bacterium]